MEFGPVVAITETVAIKNDIAQVECEGETTWDEEDEESETLSDKVSLHSER